MRESNAESAESYRRGRLFTPGWNAAARSLTTALAAVIGAVAGWEADAGPPVHQEEAPLLDSLAPKRDGLPVNADGEALSMIYCQGCHLRPDPDLLDRATWEYGALPFMEKWLGLASFNLDTWEGGWRPEVAEVFPESPLLSQEEWARIRQFYLQAAPERAIEPEVQTEFGLPLDSVQVVRARLSAVTPATTLVHIDVDSRHIYTGDAGGRRLLRWDAEGRSLGGLELPGAPVSMVRLGNAWGVGLIGNVFPSDALDGEVWKVPSKLDATDAPERLLGGLHRLTGVTAADLNVDGLPDLVVCGFGNFVGRFSWFEGKPEGGYAEHVLLDRPGAVRAVVEDFNGDGHDDIVVLMAQAREAIHLFRGDGRGGFEEQTIVERHPLFGYAHLEVLDFDGDGRLDLLTANGDNGEYTSPLKRYHGIRVHRNRGGGRFEEVLFLQMDGAFNVKAADFDADGDLDLAAISFFPDYARAPERAFVLFENRGAGRFVGRSLPGQPEGRWLTMDAGDLDGDGVPEIVLGSFIHGPNKVPLTVLEGWERERIAFVILRFD
jgi:hypothetical protein